MPPPSSLAPVYEPVSQVSTWPPKRIISSGNSEPFISAIKLFELAPDTDSLSITRFNTIF